MLSYKFFLPEDVHGIAVNKPLLKLAPKSILEFVDRPIVSHDRARGGPNQIIVILRPNEADIQPLANDPIMLPIRKSIAELNELLLTYQN